MLEIRTKIAEAIARTGWLSLTVVGAPAPTWRYTVGLTELDLPEVLVAGSAAYSNDELDALLQTVADGLRTRTIGADAQGVSTDNVEFDLVPVHASWVERLAIQAVRYYDGREVRVVQVVPSEAWVDVPQTSAGFDVNAEPAWRWLEEKWPYPCDERTLVLADRDVLRGNRIDEAIREFEADGSGSWWSMRIPEEEIPPDEPMRMVPIGTLLALDPSLEVVLELAAGQFAVRDVGSNNWLVRDIPRT
ncbi:MAG: DUF4262 domain-containing protein [Solirubrobacteraceae bacterium]|nr:DUF4262 domain-containing protein [Solirubrobacteraceae bacterium]